MTRISRNAPDGLLDRAALGASMVCLVHCLALPLLLAALPALSTVLPVSATFHLWMLVFALVASGTALVTGRASHRGWWPMLLGLAGLVFLAIGVLGFGETAFETPFTVTGALLLALAHVQNMRMRRGEPAAA